MKGWPVALRPSLFPLEKEECLWPPSQGLGLGGSSDSRETSAQLGK